MRALLPGFTERGRRHSNQEPKGGKYRVVSYANAQGGVGVEMSQPVFSEAEDMVQVVIPRRQAWVMAL